MAIWVRELLLVLVVGGVAALIHAGIHSRFSYAELVKHNDVAGFIFSVVGVIYAVVLGFVVVVVWEKYDATTDHVQIEAAAASDMYRSVGALDPAFGARMRAQLQAYARYVRDSEWPLMARGAMPRAVDSGLEAIVAGVDRYRPKGAGEIDAHQVAIRDAERLLDARRQRLADLTPSVPQLLWFALVCGATATLGFSYLFGVENRSAQLFMTGILAAVIAILFVVIHEFDLPFAGTVGVSDAAWNDFLARIPYMK